MGEPINPDLLIIKKTDELEYNNNPKDLLAADSEGNLVKTDYATLKSATVSDSKGEATPTSSPTAWAPGDPYLFEKWDVKTPGTYTNFKDGSTPTPQPIVIAAADLTDNFMQIWVTNGVSQKAPSPKPVVSGVIPSWTAQSYVGKIQVAYNNKVYELPELQTASATDVPGTSTKWVEKVGVSLSTTFKNYINPSLEVGALALNNGAVTASTTRGRPISFLDIAYAAQLELIGDMLFQNIFYYDSNNTFISTQVINGKTFTPTIPGTAVKFKFSLYHTTNTQTVTQAELDALKINCYSAVDTTMKTVVDNSNNSVKVTTDYNSFIINLGDGIYKELGGIDITTGGDVSNNIRIRTEKISVLDGVHSLTQDSGYVISRVVYYKDGVYTGTYGTSPDFTINTLTVNQIRLVWSKTNATTVITQAEVDAFKYTLQNKTVSKFEQQQDIIKKNASKVVSWFTNKKMSSLGDSITYGFIPRNYTGYPGQLDSYAKQAATLLGMTWENKGISGSTLGEVTAGDTVTRDPMVDRFSSMASDAKVVTFMGGTNDLRNISQLGTMDDRIKTTYYGALHLLIQGLLNKYVYSQSLTLYKDILIVGITPIKIYPDTAYNSLKMTNYVAAMKEVCAYYSIPCFDAYSLSGLTPSEFRTLQGTETGYTDMYNPLITDGVHPTKEGNAKWAEVFAGWLKTLVV
ncbi:SGNH/GDSL hydrolase family protein [Chryseobacterium sp. 1B4]